MARVAVSRFTVWDQTIGGKVIAPRFGTLEAIELVNGSPAMKSQQFVDQSEVDDNGFYPKRVNCRLVWTSRDEVTVIEFGRYASLVEAGQAREHADMWLRAEHQNLDVAAGNWRAQPL